MQPGATAAPSVRMPNSNWRGAQYQRLGSHESVEMGMEGAGLPFFWGGG